MRVKRLDSIENEITVTREALTKLKARYDFLSSHLEKLYEQKKDVESKNIYQKFLSSGKSYNDVMNFLTPSN